MFPSLRPLALLLVLSSQLVAQSPEAEDQVSVEFTFIGWSEGIEDISYRNGSSLREVEIAPWRYSDPYQYSGPATLAFFHKKDTESGPVASVTFDPAIRQYTILFLQDGTTFRALALPADAEHAPAGKARVFNFTKEEIALRCNDETIVLQPRESKILSAPDRNLLIIEMAYNDSQEWVKAGYRYVVLPPTKSTTVFYVQSDANFFKTADGLDKKGPQSLVLRQDIKPL